VQLYGVEAHVLISTIRKEMVFLDLALTLFSPFSRFHDLMDDRQRTLVLISKLKE
jgi:hypothetical protein